MTSLPKVLETKTSHQCHREGCNYSLQCLDCALEGVKVLYWGESGQSGRQRHRTHAAEVEKGIMSNPLVHHSIEVHGGKRSHFIAVLKSIEPPPLYKAVREAVLISMQPDGPLNLNRCMEWGNPRVPILSVEGGDREEQIKNPRPDWSKRMIENKRQGTQKRVRYWDDDKAIHNVSSQGVGVDGHHQQPQQSTLVPGSRARGPRVVGVLDDHGPTIKRPRTDPGVESQHNLENMIVRTKVINDENVLPCEDKVVSKSQEQGLEAQGPEVVAAQPRVRTEGLVQGQAAQETLDVKVDPAREAVTTQEVLEESVPVDDLELPLDPRDDPLVGQPHEGVQSVTHTAASPGSRLEGDRSKVKVDGRAHVTSLMEDILSSVTSVSDPVTDHISAPVSDHVDPV